MNDTPKIVDTVCRYAAANSLVRKKQIEKALGIHKSQVVHAIDQLVRTGRLVKIGHGTFEFVDKPLPGKGAPINDRIWKGMRIKPTFSCSELAMLAGTTTSYVYKLMRRYRGKGLVVQHGRRPALSGASEKVWRLTPKGREHLKRPRVADFEPDPLILKAVKLNRLICTGMVLHMVDERQKAMRLCREILTNLEEMKGDNDDQ